MASQRSVQHSRASERLVSVEEALEMIHTQGSDVEEDSNDSSHEKISTPTVLIPTLKWALTVARKQTMLCKYTSLSNTSLTLTWGKRLTILAETPCLNILSEVFSPFSFSFTPEKTTASDTSLAF